MDRRIFLKALAAIAAGAVWPFGLERALAFTGMKGPAERGMNRYNFTQIRYRGGDWDPDPTAATMVAAEIVKRTSVPADIARKDIDIMSPDLFHYPMLYITGHYDFEPFSEDEIRRLRNYLDYGGFLVADDCAGHQGYGFDLAIRREIKRLYPEKSMARIPRDHPVFRSFYLIKTVGGRRIVSPYLEGLELGDRTAVIYCQNDIGCAWERDQFGNWVHPCIPGGERQRRLAFKLGVNIVLYALSQDYKKDRIHTPFLRQRI
jgi:hypothetical protein